MVIFMGCGVMLWLCGVDGEIDGGWGVECVFIGLAMGFSYYGEGDGD